VKEEDENICHFKHNKYKLYVVLKGLCYNNLAIKNLLLNKKKKLYQVQLLARSGRERKERRSSKRGRE
jgi:hypothetical protein